MPKADHSADRVSIAFRLRGVFGHRLLHGLPRLGCRVSIAFRLRGVFGPLNGEAVARVRGKSQSPFGCGGSSDLIADSQQVSELAVSQSPFGCGGSSDRRSTTTCLRRPRSCLNRLSAAGGLRTVLGRSTEVSSPPVSIAFRLRGVFGPGKNPINWTAETRLNRLSAAGGLRTRQALDAYRKVAAESLNRLSAAGGLRTTGMNDAMNPPSLRSQSPFGCGGSSDSRIPATGSRSGRVCLNRLSAAGGLRTTPAPSPNPATAAPVSIAFRLRGVFGRAKALAGTLQGTRLNRLSAAGGLRTSCTSRKPSRPACCLNRLSAAGGLRTRYILAPRTTHFPGVVSIAFRLRGVFGHTALDLPQTPAQVSQSPFGCGGSSDETDLGVAMAVGRESQSPFGCGGSSDTCRSIRQSC